MLAFLKAQNAIFVRIFHKFRPQIPCITSTTLPQQFRLQSHTDSQCHDSRRPVVGRKDKPRERPTSKKKNKKKKVE